MEEAWRQDLLREMLVELAAKGYRDASVAAATERAGVSVAEFDAEFGNKDGCLFAAYEHASGVVVERAQNSCDAEMVWPERIRHGLEAVLGEVAAQPEIARAMTRAFPAIRPAAFQHYVDLVGRFVPYMREGREYSENGEELPREVELLAVGAAEAIIFSEVDAGRAQRLPRMLPEILFSVLVPFLGPDRAGDEMRSAAAAR
jgi:AcrR family transcriptional regulator